jgi:hypothetical protein
MAEVINLRLARKARARNKAAQQAAENRVLHGESAAARQRRRADEARQVRDLDAHRRDKP